MNLSQSLQRHPSTWPRLPQYALCLLLFAIPLLIGWQTYLKETLATHQRQALEEQQQKHRYLQKIQQASALAQWQIRREILSQRIQQRQQQLFNHGDVHLLLGEVAALATRHQLILAHAKPAPAIMQTHYQAQPLQIGLRGSYDDIGRFAAALAATAQPLFLADLQLSADTHERDQLRLEASVRSYRPRLPANTP
jgi:type IV pilus assembly protein PilO